MTEPSSDTSTPQDKSTSQGVEAHVRAALELGIGLGLLGVQQFKAQEKALAADLEGAGLAPIASVVRAAGKALDPPFRWLLKRASGPAR